MRLQLGAVLAVVVLVAAGCGGDDEPEAEPTSPGSPTSEPTTAPEPSPSPTATVAPATGAVLERKGVSLRIPEGWEPDRQFRYALQGGRPDGVDTVGLSVAPYLGVGGLIDLDEEARIFLKAGRYLQKPDILEPVTIDGVEFFHVGGRQDTASFLDAYGGIVRGLSVTLDFVFLETTPVAQREEVVESVLATVELQ